MAKDTSGIAHADYVVGPRNLGINAVRHLAALHQPNALPTRADRRLDMAAFRNLRHRQARVLAAATALGKLPNANPRKPVLKATVVLDNHASTLRLATCEAAATAQLRQLAAHNDMLVRDRYVAWLETAAKFSARA